MSLVSRHSPMFVAVGAAAACAIGVSGAVGAVPATAPVTTDAPTEPTAVAERTYDTFDAHQGVAVDREHFYAVDNTSITKHDRRTGEPLLQFASDEDGPIIHFDSGTVIGTKLYVAGSNYNERPMTSEIEVFDTRTMELLDTHSFGIFRGSLTWLDRHDGYWWAGFANYDKPADDGEPYGESINTQVVKMDRDFQVLEAWSIPPEVLEQFRPMSNSGGSWGPDGRLWLTGHDLGEAYVMELPEAGSTLTWVGTVRLPEVEGQAIAWDRSSPRNPTLWAIKRSADQVIRFEVPYGEIEEPEQDFWTVNGPGEFVS